MQKLIFVLSLVGQLGFIIAIPAAIFGFGGAWLDKALNTSPLFILLGLGIAIGGSSILIYKMIRNIKD